MQPRLTLMPQTPREFSLVLGVSFAAVLFCVLVVATMSLPPLPQVVVVAAIVVGLFFFTRPEVALLVFFGLRVVIDLLWWVPIEVMSLNMMELFSGAVAGLAAVLFYLELRRFNRHPAIVPFIPYVAVILIAALRNLDVREGVEIVARYLSTFLLMFLVSAFMSDTRKRIRMHMLFTLTSVVPIAVSMWFLVNGRMEMELDGYNRLVGGYQNLHNHALMMMLFACIGSFWVLYVRKVGTTIVFGAYTLAASAALYFSYVRNAQLGLVLCVFLLLLLNRRQALALGMVGLLVAAVLFSSTLQDRFDDLWQFFQAGVYESDRRMLGSGRWALWSVSMGEYLKYPIGDIFLGLGLGKHRVLTEPLYSAHYYDPAIGYIDPHNDYLSLMYQMGPTALICYVVFQIQVIRSGLYLGRRGRSAWAREFGLFMVAVSCTVFLTNFLSNAFVSRVTLGWYYWGMAGLLFGEYIDTRDVLKTQDDLQAQVQLEDFKKRGRDAASARPGALAQPGLHTRSRPRLPWGWSGRRRR
jgi:hypothetical protein